MFNRYSSGTFGNVRIPPVRLAGTTRAPDGNNQLEKIIGVNGEQQWTPKPPPPPSKEARKVGTFYFYYDFMLFYSSLQQKMVIWV